MLNSHKRMIHRYFYSTDLETPGIQPLTLKIKDKSLHGEVRLVVAIMETGLLDLDYKYILGDGLQTHCSMLDLNYKAVKAAFVGMAELVKLNKPWKE